uniref:Uncharacterized protein n=1 Tax=Chenopodium quinoa TaxID=63459 RepID=A0A803N9C7_CHEQI
MSSTEPVDHDVTQLTDEEKATINEVMKVAQTLLETNNQGAIDIPLATVAATYDSTNVGGSNDTGAFMHKAQGFPHVPIPGGGGPGPVIICCKAAVIYGTFDNDLLQLGYLLAWFNYLDHMTGAFASAEIMLLGDNLALLGASFNRVILRETTSEP